MSTLDDQDKELSGEEEAVTPSAAEEKPKEKEEGAFILLFFFVGFVASLIVGWILFPQLLYSQKKQPIDFNHAMHNELVDEGCESCHFFREDGSFSGVPKLAQCIDCHEEVQGEDPEEEKFVTEYVEKEREVPWLIYSKQPDCVFFSHAAHIKIGGMECVTCHGHIGTSEHLKDYEENRITGISRDIWGKNISGIKRNSWDRMKMNDCAACHAEATDSSTKKDTRDGIDRFIDNVLNVQFPGTVHKSKGSSVQTQKDACFVCHK